MTKGALGLFLILALSAFRGLVQTASAEIVFPPLPDSILTIQDLPLPADADQPSGPFPPRETEFLHIGESFNGYDNITAGGSPPDPYCAAGDSQVVMVGNYIVAWYDKDGSNYQHESLLHFFSQFSPSVTPTDPRVEFDQIDGHFIVTAMSSFHYLYVAVSTTRNPNGTWYKYRFDTTQLIGYTVDYPFLAVGPDAIYMTAVSYGGFNSHTPVFIIDKDRAYSGSLVITAHDPSSALEGSAPPILYVPATMYGSTPSGIGTFLIGYNGTNDTGTLHEYITVIPVKDGANDNPFYSYNLIDVGDIDSNPGVKLSAIQFDGSGPGAIRLNTLTGRVQRAVWRNGKLWAVSSVAARSAELGQSSVHWWSLEASDTLATILEQGDINGEDIALASFTFFPSIAVDLDDNVAIGFGLSGASRYAGAYFAVKRNGEAQFEQTEELAPGLAYYTLGSLFGEDVRWGDYSGISIDPDGRRFWVLNMYALTDKTWGTRWGSVYVRKDWDAPGAYQEIREVLQFQALDGDRIVVGNPPLTAPAYSSFVVDKAVQVTGVVSPFPLVDGGDDATAVEIRNPGAVVSGLRIIGGSDEVMLLEAGRISRCEVEIGGSGGTGIRTAIGSSGAIDGTWVTGGAIGFGMDLEVSTVTVDACSVAATSGTGIFLYDVSSQVRNCQVKITGGQENNFGIEADGTPVTDGCFVSVPGGYGIGGASYAGTIRRCTVVGAKWGVYAPLGSIDHCIADSISAGGFGFHTGSSNPAEFCIARGANGFDTNSQGSTSRNEDPLFCGANDYTLRIDSYGNPENNASDEGIGAFPVACAYGDLVRDTEFSGMAFVPRDLRVPSGHTLTLHPGATLKFDVLDELNQGNSQQDVELLINGTLDALGSSQLPISLISTAVIGQEGDWYGIIAPNATSSHPIRLDHVSIKQAINGLKASTSGAGIGIDVQHCKFTQNQAFDLNIIGTGTILVDTDTFDVGNGTGIYLGGTYDNGGGTINANEFWGSLGFSNGIDFEGVALNQPYLVTGNRFLNFTAGNGIRLTTTPEIEQMPSIKGNVFSDSHHGIYITKGSANIGGATTQEGNLFEANSWGVHAKCLGPGTGCRSDIEPAVKVRHNRFVDDFLPGYPLVTERTANVDAGASGDYGYNSFINNASFCIKNLSPACGTIQAVGNYYVFPGSTCATGNYCATSSSGVNAVEWLCSDPNGPLGAEVEMVAFSDRQQLRVLGSHLVSGAVSFELSGKPTVVRGEVYDVSGRLVRDLGQREFTPGLHDFTWDGRNSLGTRVPMGIHFVRLSTESGLHGTAKVLILAGGR